MFDTGIDLPSLGDLFAQADEMGCIMYEVTTIDGEAGGEIDTTQEPNPQKTTIIWAARQEIVEIDHERLTEIVKVWFN